MHAAQQREDMERANRARAVTVREYAERWLTVHVGPNCRERTAEGYRSTLTQHLGFTTRWRQCATPDDVPTSSRLVQLGYECARSAVVMKVLDQVHAALEEMARARPGKAKKAHRDRAVPVSHAKEKACRRYRPFNRRVSPRLMSSAIGPGPPRLEWCAAHPRRALRCRPCCRRQRVIPCRPPSPFFASARQARRDRVIQALPWRAVRPRGRMTAPDPDENLPHAQVSADVACCW